MDWLKSYWFILAFVFGLGSWNTLLQLRISEIDNKLDRKEFERIRERDSLKAVINELQFIKLKRVVNPPPETTKVRDSTTIIKEITQ